jgi:hypothetical protein
MRMSADKNETPSAERSDSHPERCADCGAALVDDQRYCLHCVTRRGQPRIDFSAFWKPSSPTEAGRQDSETPSVRTDGSSWLAAGAPSRRMAGVLAAGVLAVGIVAGAALGPAPTNSPADSSTLARQAIAALVASTDGSSQQASAPASPTPTPSVTEPSTASTTAQKPKTTSNVPGKTNAPASSEGTPSSESSAGSPSSEGSSPEGAATKGSGESEQPAPGTPVKLPPIKHVWVITLSGASFANALAQPQTDPYLAKQLVPKGTLLSGYTLGASSALANGIALLSGQGVNLETEQNCPTYNELQPATVNATNGLAEGVGCVYPAAIKTLPDELTAAGLTWKAYVQGMQEGAPGTTSSPAGAAPAAGAPTPSTTGAPAATGTPGPTVTCRHPELGAADPNHVPAPGGTYLTFRNPFVYFHSLLDGGACASNDVDLSQLQSDLATPASTPSLSWVVPSACEDGSSTPCSAGAAAGLGPADSFLKEVVGQILTTTAYRKEGLIVIVPDSAPGSSSSSATKPVGALLISPFVHSGARVAESLNGFSLLKNLARLFGVLPLGHANDPSTVSFGATVYGTNGKAATVASTAKKAAQAASAAQPRHLPASHAGG